MKIVVTGALGHIGSRLVRELPAMSSDAEIVMLDNLLTQRYCSLFNLPAHGRYRFLEDDVLTADLPSIFEGATAVVHLAAITDATNSFRIKDKVEQVNFAGTERVSQACLMANCALIFPSTTSVYGSQADEVDEDCPVNDLKPQSPYAEAKLRAERLLKNLGKEKRVAFHHLPIWYDLWDLYRDAVSYGRQQVLLASGHGTAADRVENCNATASPLSRPG